MSDHRTRHCKVCGEPIIYLSTKTKPIGVDADSVVSNETKYDPSKHVKHADTCEGYTGD